jgi:hypothetical protein
MASTAPRDVLLGYYRASLGLPPLHVTTPATDGGSSSSGRLSTSGLVAAVVVSVCVGGGGLVVVGALLVQLQRARTRSLTGKVSVFLSRGSIGLNAMHSCQLAVLPVCSTTLLLRCATSSFCCVMPSPLMLSGQAPRYRCGDHPGADRCGGVYHPV